MADRIVVFGATGYTGELIAVAAGRRRRAPGAGRAAPSPGSRHWPTRLGGLEWVRADAMRQNTVFDLVGPGDVLISTVGPFAKWGLPAVRAAVAAGLHATSTRPASPTFIRRVFAEFDGPAGARARALLPAMGYDFAPGALAGALALSEAGEDAVRVDVGYYALGGGRDVAVGGDARVAGRDHAGRRLRVPRRRRCGARGRPSGCARSTSRASRARRSRSAAPSTSRCRRRSRAARGQRVPRLVRAAVAAVAGGVAGRRRSSQRVPLAAPTMRLVGERAVGAAARARTRARRRAGARGSPRRRSTRPGA